MSNGKSTDALIFGARLRQRRSALGLGLVEFAKACGIDAGLLSRIENGKRPPPEMPGLVLFAKHLNIALDSAEFSEFLAAADHDRHPALHQMALDMRGGKPWNPFAKQKADEVLCNNLGELVAKATEQAIRVDATAIAVYAPSGRARTYRLRQKAK